jgi:hypothetical protein
MGQKRETNFNNMMMFPFNSPIMLMGMGTWNVVGSSTILEVRNKSSKHDYRFTIKILAVFLV